MTHRAYSFKLPVHVPGFYVSTAVSKIVASGCWKELPFDFATKINAAVTSRSSFDITQEDLDAIPDSAWEHISAKLGLH